MYREDYPNIEGLLEKAKEVMPDYQNIINMQDMTFVCIGDKVAELMGVDPREILGKKATDFMPMDANSLDFEETVLNAMRMATIVCPIQHRDGRVADVKMLCLMTDFEGTPYLVARFLLDENILQWKNA